MLIAAGLRILYGGSVKAGNARDIFSCPTSTATDRRRLAQGRGILAIVAAAWFQKVNLVMLHLRYDHSFLLGSGHHLWCFSARQGADAGALWRRASGRYLGSRRRPALSRATTILAGIFMLTSLSLTYVGSHTAAAPSTVSTSSPAHAQSTRAGQPKTGESRAGPRRPRLQRPLTRRSDIFRRRGGTGRH